MRRLRRAPTLTGYSARQYLFWFGTLYCSIVAIIFLATIVDLLDRLATKDVSLTITLKMALMKLPYLSQEVMPFTILFAAMATFWRSEEHTSELQSLMRISYAVFCLKQKTQKQTQTTEYSMLKYILPQRQR